jgi:hypothetical protein
MAKIDLLRDWVSEADTHKKVVGDFDGNYTLGVTDDPPALLLRVEGADVRRFPTQVNLHGQDIAVHVKGSYQRPVLLPAVVRSK